LSVMLLASSAAHADEPEEEGDVPDPDGDAEGPETPDAYDVSVFGHSGEEARVAGSAHRVGEEELEKNEDDDVHRILNRIPAVYVRNEDGYGLRPNIGMRGATSDRSRKVNLLEDGVLLGPAPYSAPAAYYFPLMTRMTAVEVFKGASAIRHGPNTIGGTINFVTRPIPMGHRFGADLAIGTELYGKGHGYYGYGTDRWGVLVEGVRLRSSGFKDLDSGDGPLGDNTGFEKTEVMLKARVNSPTDEPLYNEGQIKVTYSREVSNETYLGLSDADFGENPYRRYSASALDEMRWNRLGVELSHGLVLVDDEDALITWRTTAYRHDFGRVWHRVNGMAGVAISQVLADPTSPANAPYYDVLTGRADTASPDQDIILVNNDRTFVSQGVQSALAWRLPLLGPVGQRLMFGARIHNDSIDRVHTSEPHAMIGGLPRRTNEPATVTDDNVGSAIAFSTYLIDEVSLGPVLLTPGVRFEYIANSLEDRQTDTTLDTDQYIVLPGIGLLYQPIEEIGILAGVNRGFSPVTPGQAEDVQPEVAVNYEAGVRLTTEFIGGEVVGFVSDYSNLTGECGFSSGCSVEELDTQYNAGEALIYGVEASGKADIATPIDLHIPITVTYTFTGTRFDQSFTSPGPEFGEVEEGDELPFVPPHQVAASVGLASERWGELGFGMTFVDSMREVAGQGEPAPGEATDAYLLIDANASLKLTPEIALYAKVDNLLNNDFIASRRPFGARPGRPRFLMVGVKVDIERQ
jgi:Fe(3+) dicitrate transport protein